ncbi:prgI family protein [Clostridium argentinense CDC 2741]|uniref:PrgI family protein n=2 Tax=Clostridium argentinense TaxID=29341 RepID=A0A0C1TUF5_9CLOT|nr:PrgI family protein [Clostridium argentinense]ARC83107.1 PrgI family protein [Clostridium argentinense]KIE44394.1 prgI family protein [Clostridium argentinense CDC 2741]
MRRFTVPFDIDFEDKIIGGKYSLRQAGWLILPIFYAFFSFSNKNSFIRNGNIIWISVIFKIFIIGLLGFVAIIFAFHKKNQINYDKYLLKLFKFTCRKKIFKSYE